MLVKCKNSFFLQIKCFFANKNPRIFTYFNLEARIHPPLLTFVKQKTALLRKRC